MTKPIEQEPLDLPAAAEAQPDGQRPGPPLDSAPYIDFPRFLGWAPLPIYYSSVASQEIVVAPAAIFYGVSNLEAAPPWRRFIPNRRPAARLELSLNLDAGQRQGGLLHF